MSHDLRTYIKFHSNGKLLIRVAYTMRVAYIKNSTYELFNVACHLDVFQRWNELMKIA